MSAIKVKVSGVTNLADALAAAEAGADFVGFVFYDKSPRCLPPQDVRAIVSQLPPSLRTVGVFVDERPERVAALLDECGVDLAQLDGSEPPPEVRRLAPRAYKTLRPQGREGGEAMAAMYRDVVPDAEDRPAFLLEAHQSWRWGEPGAGADWHSAKVLARHFRIMLGGGLTAATVADAVREIRPWGIDLSFGVEAGSEPVDHEEVRRFVTMAREAAS